MTSEPGAASAGTGLRLARLARGFSQQQLAGMAGISRQAVSAVESGLSDPSLRVALALAHALGLTVEELFGPGSPAPLVPARPLAPLGTAGGRVVLAPVGDSLVALPLSGATATRRGFLAAGGQAEATPPPTAGQPAGDGPGEDGTGEDGPAGDGPAGNGPGGDEPAGDGPAGDGPGRDEPGEDWPAGDGSGQDGPEDGAEPGGAGPAVSMVRPIGPPRPMLVVAGCDPALPLIEAPLALLDPPVAFTWWPCGSSEALRLAAAGLVHVAGAHLRDFDGDYNTSAAGDLLGSGAEIVQFGAWREGLVLRPERAAGITGVGDLPGSGLRLVNRDPGSEARRVLDRELASAGISPAEVPGYDTRAMGHLEVAAAIAAGVADVGVASEPAALAYELAFVPLTQERFDLVIPAAQSGAREVQAMLRVLSSPWLLAQLASLPGYDSSHCGERLSASQAPGAFRTRRLRQVGLRRP
ncbi:MAG TPA: substrate-binding domain-containing protein [Streptosporangiaceae bacterium]